MKTLKILTVILSCMITSASAKSISSSITTSEVPKVKSTSSELYLSSQDAYNILKEDPEILFVDVRDQVEIGLSGHPSLIDAIVPVRVHSTEFDHNINEYVLKDNPDFISKMHKTLKHFGKSKHDMVIITCGSGYRSAVAARKLHKAGFTNVWHITDGYPGEEKIGKNSSNAWQLLGLPWSRKSTIYGSEWQLLISQ